MIQRSQTIYLILAALCGVLTFFVPYAHFLVGDVKISEYAMFGLFNLQSQVVESSGPYLYPAWAIGALSVIVPIAAIFLYKNRPAQGRVVRLAYLIDLGYIVYLFFAIDALRSQFYDESMSVLHHVGFYAPVAGIVFAFLAARGIKKDEALVRSLDRLR